MQFNREWDFFRLHPLAYNVQEDAELRDINLFQRRR